MMVGYWERRRERWRAWRQTPLKWWQRAIVCFATMFYFVVIASVVTLFWGGIPLLPAEDLFLGLAKWCIPAAIFGGVLAYAFPRTMLCIVYPLTFFGIGDTSVT